MKTFRKGGFPLPVTPRTGGGGAVQGHLENPVCAGGRSTLTVMKREGDGIAIVKYQAATEEVS